MTKHKSTTTAQDQIIRAQAKRLRLMRELSGLEVADAAEITDVSRFVWYRMEQAVTKIDVTILHTFCKRLHRSTDYVVTGEFTGFLLAEQRALREMELELERQDREPEAKRRGRNVAEPASVELDTSASTQNTAPQRRRKKSTVRTLGLRRVMAEDDLEATPPGRDLKYA